MNLDYLLGNIKDEKPLDNIVTDGGFTCMLRNIVCVGDSLSSGEFQHKVGVKEDGTIEWDFVDNYDFSWGQFMARASGTKVYNFSRGGMTTREYIKTFADSKGFFNEDIKAEAYVIALGVNDFGWAGVEMGEVGDINVEDYTQNKETYAGYMGQIISKYKKISPDARFFLVVPPKDLGDMEKRKRHQALLYEIAKLYTHTFVIDLFEYGPYFGDKDFREKYFMYGHMTPAGYIFFSKLIVSYIDYIIRHNFREFKLIGFANTPKYDEKDALAPFEDM